MLEDSFGQCMLIVMCQGIFLSSCTLSIAQSQNGPSYPCTTKGEKDMPHAFIQQFRCPCNSPATFLPCTPSTAWHPAVPARQATRCQSLQACSLKCAVRMTLQGTWQHGLAAVAVTLLHSTTCIRWLQIIKPKHPTTTTTRSHQQRDHGFVDTEAVLCS